MCSSSSATRARTAKNPFLSRTFRVSRELLCPEFHDYPEIVMDLRHEVMNMTNSVIALGNRIGERNYLFAKVNKQHLGGRAPESFVGGAVPTPTRRNGEVFGNLGRRASPHWNPVGTAHMGKRPQAEQLETTGQKGTKRKSPVAGPSSRPE